MVLIMNTSPLGIYGLYSVSPPWMSCLHLSVCLSVGVGRCISDLSAEISTGPEGAVCVLNPQSQSATGDHTTYNNHTPPQVITQPTTITLRHR